MPEAPLCAGRGHFSWRRLAISPDGKWLLFTSSRDSSAGARSLTQHVIDISSLGVGPAGSK
jgi:Tol biopolymer transport system component